MNANVVRIVGPTEVMVIVAVIGVGCAWFVTTAWKARSASWSFKHFFLGGRNIGPELTQQSNWGLTFAWANGIWFFAVLGYSYGPGVILLQIPWCVSVAVLAALLRQIMRAAKDSTIHGYLGATYGSKARQFACIATSIGYVFNCGFEMFWASRMFSLSLGLPKLVYPAAISLSALCGAYCMVGGYIANCRTDKHQNILGMFAITAVCAACGFGIWGRPGVAVGLLALAGVCLVYAALAFYVPRARPSNAERLQNIVALTSIPLVFAIAAVLVWRTNADSGVGDPASPIHLFACSMPPWQLIAGITVFQLFFNFVDMANWQTISANAEIPPEDYTKLRWSFVRSAIYMLWFPALCGILVGCFLRIIPKLTDDGIFPAAFAQVFPEAGGVVRGVIVGLVMLGLFSTSLSSADTYLMAAAHTLSWDLFRHNEYVRIIALPQESSDRLEAEADFCDKVRTKLIFLAVGMTLVFALFHFFWPDTVFAFQFIMYGSALALLPGVAYALKLQGKNRQPAAELGPWIVASIIAGIVAALLPYLWIYLIAHVDTSSLTPIFTLSASAVFFGIGWLRHRKSSKAIPHHEDTL
jgi:hypothetical protein